MLELQQPTKQQLEFIYGEFDTTPEAVQRDVKTLIEWMEKQAHLPKIKDEDILTNCLLRCKNSVEKAKVVLDAYYTLKAAMPDVYENRDPDDEAFSMSFKSMSFIPLRKLTSDGCRVSILRVFDPEEYTKIAPDDIIKGSYMSADLRLKIDKCRSDVLIFDLQDYTMPIITITMANLRKFLILGTKGMPMRHKSVYIVNAPSSAESLIMLGKSFVRKELVKKLAVLRNKEELLSHIPAEILPKDYGGLEPPLSEIRDEWLDTLRHYRDWFLSEGSVKADISKRLVHTNSRLGSYEDLDGSFRRIAID